jgi:hypothetical protein
MEDLAMPAPSASDIVKSYLTTMEARDLATAETCLAPGFSMTFPGGHTFTQLQDLVVFARDRYRFVKKTYDRFDEAPATDGTIVYCYGTLSGAWLDGSTFSGIRFIDRFTVRGGKLVDQQVWNDLAEHQAAMDKST